MDIVNIPNQLICAQYSMSLRAKRLKVIALTKLAPIHYVIGLAPKVVVTAKEWQNIYIDSEQPYRDLKIAVNDFGNATVRFKDDLIIYKFLDSAKYIPRKGKVVLYFNSSFLKKCIKK